MKDQAQILYLEWALYALLAIFLLVSTIALWISHRSNRYKEFQLIDLITNSAGIASRPAMMELAAFVLMSWAFIVFVVRGTLSEWYAGLFVGAFVLRAAYSAFLGSKKPNGHPPQPGAQP